MAIFVLLFVEVSIARDKIAVVESFWALIMPCSLSPCDMEISAAQVTATVRTWACITDTIAPQTPHPRP